MRLSSFFILSLLTLNLAVASPTSPKDGADYTTLKAPQTTQATGKKVEVIEFFMYHCPACFGLERELTEWVKSQGDSIVLRRIHLASTGPADPEAHLFLTLEAMKKEDALHASVLRTWHVERKRLMSDDDNVAWAVKNGLDKKQFLEFYNSFAVMTKLRGVARLAAGYQVNSTPTLVVDGRYVTSPATVDAANPGTPYNTINKATLQVVQALVAKAAAAKAAK